MTPRSPLTSDRGVSISTGWAIDIAADTSARLRDRAESPDRFQEFQSRGSIQSIRHSPANADG